MAEVARIGGLFELTRRALSPSPSATSLPGRDTKGPRMDILPDLMTQDLTYQASATLLSRSSSRSAGYPVAGPAWQQAGSIRAVPSQTGTAAPARRLSCSRAGCRSG